MNHFARIAGENFRLFARFELRPHERFNLITGANAAGKTSLLEAVFCLGRAKSFRGGGPGELAGAAGRHWYVQGAWRRRDVPAINHGVRWSPEGIRIRAAQADIGAVELIRACPVQVMEPAMHRLLQDGPGYRRSFLDWGVFHVEQEFLPLWRRHQRALRQRNRTLKLGSSAREIGAWDTELAEAAERLNALRSAHLDALAPALAARTHVLFDGANCTLDLHAGWPAGSRYAKALRAGLERDRRAGMTLEGAHRAELRIRLNHHQAKNRISRGQQKLLIAAMILTQAEWVHRCIGIAPVLLVDDFAAELAPDYQRALLELLAAYPGQVFMTAFEAGAVTPAVPDFALFHVEHGVVRQC